MLAHLVIENLIGETVRPAEQIRIVSRARRLGILDERVERRQNGGVVAGENSDLVFLLPGALAERVVETVRKLLAREVDDEKRAQSIEQCHQAGFAVERAKPIEMLHHPAVFLFQIPIDDFQS